MILPSHAICCMFVSMSMSRSINYECAKFRGSRVSSDVVPLCLRAFVGISWGPNFFLVGISWVQSFFSLVFRGSKIFLVGIRGSEIFSSGYFAGPKFSLVGDFVIFSFWPHEKMWHRNISQTPFSIPNRFQQL